MISHKIGFQHTQMQVRISMKNNTRERGNKSRSKQRKENFIGKHLSFDLISKFHVLLEFCVKILKLMFGQEKNDMKNKSISENSIS